MKYDKPKKEKREEKTKLDRKIRRKQVKNESEKE